MCGELIKYQFIVFQKTERERARERERERARERERERETEREIQLWELSSECQSTFTTNNTIICQPH